MRGQLPHFTNFNIIVMVQRYIIINIIVKTDIIIVMVQRSVLINIIVMSDNIIVMIQRSELITH